MKFSNIVSFRKDLLFNGAVQISWLENDMGQAKKAAEHYIFHGPDYHGVANEDFEVGDHKLIDTASFALDIIERINCKTDDDPFALAIAGYGTGKSHLGITLASLLKEPESEVSQKIIENISKSDSNIGMRVKNVLAACEQPFIIVAINGMQDFDMSSEVIRQILLFLNHRGIDTTPLENLRPRFKSAIYFTESFYDALENDFKKRFGGISSEAIVERLKCQDEEIFRKVSEIYEQKMGSPIRAVGQESLHDFIRVVKETYCGTGKPFSGILIIFDEFGRYMEFAVQKPHVAGSGALQQLFESVQANGDKVFLLCFIQYELKAYISRVAPELREDLNRYVTRYDAVRKVRLSTNLETLIANLLDKKDPEEIDKYVSIFKNEADELRSKMFRWFPDIKNHAVWSDKNRFERIICKGCWPFHPLSTWVLYKLSSVGKSLQQRSALSFLADAYSRYEGKEIGDGKTIAPVDLCSDAMINEFLASEQFGQQGASAHAYESVLQKYRHELNTTHKNVLKAVLLSAKIGVKLESKSDCMQALTAFCNLDIDSLSNAVHTLESEYGLLEWNERLCQYEIAGDAVPKRAFLSFLNDKVASISTGIRSEIFSQNYLKWFQNEEYNTDFGSQKDISTREWNYKIYYSNVSMLDGQISFAMRNWLEARSVDEYKGQLIYCYVGPESNIDSIREKAKTSLKIHMQKNGLTESVGAPISVIFLNDSEGSFGYKIAEYWVLQERMSEEDKRKYNNFILDRMDTLKQEIENQFTELEKMRIIEFATDKEIPKSRVKNMLTSLFNVIYEKCIPFPFDGFHTSRGNAAKDCQIFTKELILGNLDRDWIAARNSQQRNRAYAVLDKSWGAIDLDGSIRMKPSNSFVREFIDILETKFEDKIVLSESSKSVQTINLGEVARVLCAPPFGCNIASAGLIIALFIGRRKKTINLIKDGQAISIESWLHDAMPGNYFELSVLDSTYIIQVSKESLSEWEVLLDEWSSEVTLLGKVEFLEKAIQLEKRIPVPQEYFYKYKLLNEHAITAKSRLNEYNSIINNALGNIKVGIDKEDVSKISWGAAELSDLLNSIKREGSQWTNEQIIEVENRLSKARVQTQRYFSKWLPTQKVVRSELLSSFKHRMISLVGTNLQKLDMIDEYILLKEHVEKIEKNVEFLTKVRNISSDIDRMIQGNRITNATPIATINNLLEQIKDYENILDNAYKRIDVAHAEIQTAHLKLADYKKICKNQIADYNERVSKLYNIEEINTLTDIANWRSEVAALILIYEGKADDIEDFKLIQKQLELMDRDYRMLDDFRLGSDEFEAMCAKVREEADACFEGDAPPLDNDSIYEGIINSIRIKREEAAKDWINKNLPDIEEIGKFSADTAIEYKRRLSSMPRVLSNKQAIMVKKAIDACTERLDDLEVEGLIVRFNALPDGSKKKFVKMVLETMHQESEEF